MTNRKTNQKRPGRMKAPKDDSALLDGLDESMPRSRGSYVLLGVKVVSGLVLLAVTVGALAFGVHRYAQTTPRFAVSTVEIQGTKRLLREDVLAASGIQKGQNIFSLQIEKAERALVDSPWISSARVTRRLPGTVKLDVVEREPKAIAVISDKNFLVSQDGTPFKELGSGDPHDLPLITGITARALSQDRRAEIERIVQTLGLLQTYEKLAVSGNYPIQEAHLSDTGSVSLVVGEPATTLHLGLGPFKKKLLRAERVLSKTRHDGGQPHVVFLDNEAHPERVVVRVQ